MNYGSAGRLLQHPRFQICLLEMTIGGQRVGEEPSVHDHERKAICQAPTFIGTRSVKSDSSVEQFGLKRNYLDVHIRMRSPIALRCYTSGARVRKCVQPFPQDRLGG